MTGQTPTILLGGALTSTATLAWMFFKNEQAEMRHLKILTLVSMAIIAAISLWLWFLIFTDDFTTYYVAQYSSRDLPAMYKISVFWAGQAGSLLFWLLIHAMIGSILAYHNAPMKAMGVYFSVQCLLNFLVVLNSPFWENPIAQDDGFGLNPLLQDPWMAIHPPLVFAGYAILAVPLSLSLGNLLESSSKKWLEPARKWTLIASVLLGAGIFIGGYWAYKVLGWGGYWAWDPVENSSLVPWLVSVVLLHLIILSKKKSAVLPMAHIAAVFTYSLVIYGTFLTRSGVLGEFSVHSFASSKISLAIALVNAIIFLGGLLIILIKAKDFPRGRMYENFKDPAYATLLGMLMLVFIAIVVWLGMSAPLILQFFGKAAAVSPTFYEAVTKPLALIMAAIMIYIFVKVGWQISFGGKIAHLGVLAGVAAMIISAQGETVDRIFMNNIEVDVFGHKFTYNGQIFETDSCRKFYVFNVDGQEVRALTKLRENGDDAAREPAILRNFTGDIYIAPNPNSFRPQELILDKGRFQMDGEIGYTFKSVEVKHVDDKYLESITAEIEVTDGVTTENVQLLINFRREGAISYPVEFLNGKRRIRLIGVSDDRLKLRLEILPTLEEISQLPIIATISTKPFIWVLWLSAAAVCAGTLAAVKK